MKNPVMGLSTFFDLETCSGLIALWHNARQKDLNTSKTDLVDFALPASSLEIIFPLLVILLRVSTTESHSVHC